MGTRSLTHFHGHEELGRSIDCSMFRHFDGYPNVHGLELARWLEGKRVVNGIGADFTKGVDFNGVGQMIIPLSNDFLKYTSVYIVNNDTAWNADYEYHVGFVDGDFLISFDDYDEDGREVSLSLSPSEFIKKYGNKDCLGVE